MRVLGVSESGYYETVSRSFRSRRGGKFAVKAINDCDYHPIKVFDE